MEAWKEELYHHGILGMHWGIRRYQNEDGSLTEAGRKRYGPPDARIIPKGTKIHRIANNKNDVIYDKKKYVSLTDEDNQKWLDYFKEGYKGRDVPLYDIMYRSTKDLKIAPATKLGEMFVEEKMNNKLFAQQTIRDTNYAVSGLGRETPKNVNERLSYNLAMQTETGKRYVQKLINMGYDGIEDMHGRNVADDPVVVFDPQRNLRKKSTNKVG